MKFGVVRFPGSCDERDALLAALTLDTFHRHADKVVMANVAQLVNCLHSLFLAHEDKFLATPTFDVFEMYGAHVGGESVRAVFSAPRIQYQRVNASGSIWGLAGSASIKDKTLTVTLVNPHVSEPRVVEIAVGDAADVVLAAQRFIDVVVAVDGHDIRQPGERLGCLFVGGLEILAVAAPGGVELDNLEVGVRGRGQRALLSRKEVKE